MEYFAVTGKKRNLKSVILWSWHLNKQDAAESYPAILINYTWHNWNDSNIPTIDSKPLMNPTQKVR